MFINQIADQEAIRAVVVLVLAIIAAWVVKIVVSRYLSRLFKKTASDLDDKIFSIITAPVVYFILISGLYLSFRTFGAFQPYFRLAGSIYLAVSILLGAITVSRVINLLLDRWLQSRGSFQKTPQLIQKIVSIIVFAIAAIMVLSNLGVEITPLLATLGVGGLAVGLALQSTLSNIFSGLYILSDRPVNVGDYIELQGGQIAGFVEDIGWRTTKIKTRRNDIVIIPNSQLAETVITNYYLLETQSSFLVECGVDYSSDLDRVESVTIEVAKQVLQNTEGGVKDFEPSVRFHTFADSNINFSVTLRAERYIDKVLLTHEFIKALKKRFDREKIEISWPVRKIQQMK